MLIRFHCLHCDEPITLHQEKVGTEIACPQCGFWQTVPAQDEEGPDAGNRDAPSKDEGRAEADAGASADEGPSVHQGAEFRVPTSELTGSCGFRVPSQEPPALTATVPSGMILFPRRVFYVQAALYLVVALVSLGLGYLMGRGGPSGDDRSDEKTRAQNRVPVEGKVTYETRAGLRIGDEGALVIVVPGTAIPSSPLSVRAIREAETEPAKDRREPPAIHDAQGGYARVDQSGVFTLFVPQRGRYHVLVLSRHVTRPSAAPLPDQDRMELARYFDRVDDLLEGFQYRWTSVEISLGSGPIDVDFSRTSGP